MSDPLTWWERQRLEGLAERHVQKRGKFGVSVCSLAPTKTAWRARGVGQELLGSTEWLGTRVNTVALCDVETITNGESHEQLLGGARVCTAQNGRREALEAAVYVDPGL